MDCLWPSATEKDSIGVINKIIKDDILVDYPALKGNLLFGHDGTPAITAGSTDGSCWWVPGYALEFCDPPLGWNSYHNTLSVETSLDDIHVAKDMMEELK